MLSTVSALLGGVGLFLLGMILMTEGLRSAAGGSLQRTLGGLTRGPGQAIAAGAGITALVQSSSATTVATIGFVSAGMLTFPQALGVIMGANLGTTSTGWIVALLGLKFRIAAVALPLVGAGALLRLLLSGRRAQVGLALAGFGLIFVGIDVLQEGMAGAAARLDPASFPSPESVSGAVGLVLLGAVTTVAMQSSSAAVATTLTALHAGTLGLSHAAYLVVGQNLGTTVTAALAAVGASVPARRTALGHILFNLATGVVALAVLPFALPPMLAAVEGFAPADLTLVIAAFHTGFNVLGVVLFLPVIGAFSALVIRIVPEGEPLLTRHLDRSMQEIPSVALEAARGALRELAAQISEALVRRLEAGRSGPGRTEADPALDDAVARIREFLGSLDTSTEGAEEFGRHVGLLHAMDHLDRLLETAREEADPSSDPEAVGAAADLKDELREACSWLRDGEEVEGTGVAERMANISSTLADARRRQREELLERTARGVVSPRLADERLHGMRWVDRVGYHAWRIVHHLALRGGEPPAPEPGFEGRDRGRLRAAPAQE